MSRKKAAFSEIHANTAAALSKAVEIFAAHNETAFGDLMSNGLQPIAAVTGLDRVSIYRLAKDVCRLEQIYVWEYGKTADLGRKPVNLSNYPHAGRWLETLAKGECINGNVRDMAEEEAAFLGSFGIKSILFAPVFTRGVFWGVVTLEDRTLYRYFDEDCLGMLRAAAHLCANAFIRLETEAKAVDAEALTRAVTETCPFPCVMIDESLNVIDCNNAAIEIFDCPDKQYLLDNYWSVLSLAEQPNGEDLYTKIKTAFAELPIGERQVYEWVHRSRSGELIAVENTLTLIKYNGRKVAVSFKYDLRKVKMLMADIRRKSDQLKEALERMTAASEAKGTFLSNMSHEMRTPLNTISGMASIGKSSPDAARKDYALGKIEDASAHLLGVINDVLDMSKIEANMLELVTDDFSFEYTLKKAVNSIYFRMAEKHHKFYASIDRAIPHVLVGDDQRLTQVILNLLSNAVKFTPEGGTIRLNARLLAQTDGVNTIAIEVVDTGIGFAPEQKARLFHAFEQADSGISRKFGGTGLGLTISERIVAMMGGAFSVSSVPGEGSSFTFTFQAASSGDSVSGLLFDPSVNWEAVNILVVDDDQEILSCFREMFAHYGIQCDTVSNGYEALERIDGNGGYDVCFVDWRMPQMSGFELTKQIKARNRERQNKSLVVMISAVEWLHVRNEAEDAGVDRYLTKPLFASDIIACLNACVAKPGTGVPKQHEIVKAGELKGCRILLAEDVEINREILLALMEDTEAEIDCAENGIEVLRLMDENPGKYDLIFMDMQMPEMDGLETTRRIRRFDGETPIIAMTANVFREDVEKCLAAGMDDHLGKPLDMDDVLKKTRKYWGGYRTPRTFAAALKVS